jgi:3-phytase
MTTGENYGGTLYRSGKTGTFYFVTTSKSGVVEQHELIDDGTGRVVGRKVRTWIIGKCEGAVADDEAGKLYISEEEKGVWEVDGEPDGTTPGKLVIKINENGLTGDIEGLTIYPAGEGWGYLIVSNQGGNNFKVYQRDGGHDYLGSFVIKGAEHTDGVDVCSAHLGPSFAHGLFACHTDRGTVLLTPWQAIAKTACPDLIVDTSWRPRE